MARYVAMPRWPKSDRFAQKVGAADARGCWPWLGSCNHGGYGHLTIGGRLRTAHRVAWERVNGPIPVGAHVLHHCDNPPCVNPAHLFLGDNDRNVADKVAKGRQYRAADPRVHVMRVPINSAERAMISSLAIVEQIAIAELMRRAVRFYGETRKGLRA